MRSVAILTGVDTHLDHLGILSHLLGIPLIVTEPATYAAAKKYYPQFDVTVKDLSELSLDFLADHFDVIFETGKFWALSLSSSLELLCNKKMRFVFCPHGTSDKGHSLQESVSQDVSLVYGQHLLDLLKHNGSLAKINHIVETGNYRRAFYLKHKVFYDALAQTEVFARFVKEKPIILYAPTWHTKESPTSFFSTIETLIDQLSADFHLLIKLHPFLMEDHPAHTLAVMDRYEKHPSALFLTDFPPIYPLLDKCALYLGDYSSIGYDFLAFDKPLFFLPTIKPFSGTYTSPLYQCGISVLPEELPYLKQVILAHCEKAHDRYSALRNKTYHYAFGEEKPIDVLRQTIFNSLSEQ